MSADELQQHMRRRPFVPFVVVTTDGTRYLIPHPEFLMPTKRSVVIGVPATPGDTVPEATVYLSLLHLQRVEIQEPAQT
jgi:hypothetical protein